MKQTTLCYLEQDGRYLMLHRVRKAHDENHDKWIGVGGKFEDRESPEDCARREVLEETGLRVRNLRFYKSQPWVFTDTLLFGFFAELDGSDKITVQEDELSEAGWFSRDEIDLEDDHLSLTREMIMLFKQNKI